jgi:hypothetical protein
MGRGILLRWCMHAADVVTIKLLIERKQAGKPALLVKSDDLYLRSCISRSWILSRARKHACTNARWNVRQVHVRVTWRIQVQAKKLRPVLLASSMHTHVQICERLALIDRARVLTPRFAFGATLLGLFAKVRSSSVSTQVYGTIIYSLRSEISVGDFVLA